MNSTTKKFLSAIFATAIVFTQAGAAVSAATSSPWGTSTSQIAQSFSPKTTSKNYNNSSDYTDTDKYGNAFPYTYYFKVAQNKSYKTLYKYIADALRDRKASLKFKGYAKKFSTQPFYDVINDLRDNCPDLYYVNNCSVEKNGDDIIVKFSYIDEATYNSNKKKIDKYLANFDAYLKKNNVTSTKDFFNCALAYIGKTVSYDYAAAKTNRTGKIDKNSLNIIGAIVDGEVVCEGYARTFNLLCMTYGIPFAEKSLDNTTTGSGHMISCAMYNNAWYNFDPTCNKNKDYQFTTDSEYLKIRKEYKIVKAVKSPVCDGKKSSATSTSTSSSSSTSKVTSKSALLNNNDFRIRADAVSRFEVMLKNHFRDYASEYDTFTYTFASKADPYLESCVETAKKLKKEGTISYKSIEICTPETGERFILIYLK